MSRPFMILTYFILFLCLSLSLNAANKKQPRIIKIDQPATKELRVRANLRAADTCIVRNDQGIEWRIDGWVIGNELYKNYLDPSLSCPNPYPFNVTEVAIVMYFATTTDIYVSVDVEDVDLTNPSCPMPDSLLGPISQEYVFTIPDSGLYEIWVPFDTPIEVNGPFFAGFFIGNALDPAVGAAVITDSNQTAVCRSYNIWDETIGYIDLLNNSMWNFPGQLVLYASGIPGQSAPPPEITIISPEINQNLFGKVNIWAKELSGSNIIDYVSFEYSNGGSFTEIGRDYDGTSPLRDGTNNSGPGNGFSFDWDFSSRSEGTYILRTTAYDTLGQSASDELTVYLEPTPPTPNIISPVNGSDFCPPFEILMSCNDENLSKIDIQLKNADSIYNAGIVTLNQFNFGDNNGNPNDGNSVANGEFGDRYSGPVAAALAIKLWADRGYSYIMKEGFTTITIDTLVERLAVLFNTRANNGTYDEDLYLGLETFNDDKGNPLILSYERNPDYFSLRNQLEEEEKAVIMALGSTPGMWVAVNGFTGWQQLDGSYLITANNPLNGAIDTMSVRDNTGTLEIYINGNWQRIDMIVAIGAVNWNINRTLIATDNDGADGWSANWTPGVLNDNNQYFLRTEGTDANGFKDASTIILNYDCSQFFASGDYDNDGFTNIGDLNILIEFLINNGPSPYGGSWRGDANCDNHINITDIVYYINFIFGTVGPPCH